MESSDLRDNKDLALLSGTLGQPKSEVTSEKPTFTPGDIIGNRYRVVRFIARGGMGEVYEVEDSELRERVALKTIAPERASSPRQISRFRQEIQLARKVSHPNVCRVFDLGRHRGTNGDVLFLTMELLPGETLAAHLREHGPMSCEQALPLVRQMVSALSAAHQAGIVHRDFKPGNVMLLESANGPVVKVTDFGLATDPDSEETVSHSLTEIIGTPEYMAPEQLRGQCSTLSDVYALGMTVFQMLTGGLPAATDAPFKGQASGSGKSHPISSAKATGSGKLASRSATGKRIPQRWRAAITKALAGNPMARFESVEEFWYALSGETPTGRLGWIGAGILRHRALYASVAGLLLAAIVLIMAGVLPNPFRPLPQEKHIAVLPFENIGGGASAQAFAEGVSASLTSNLSQLERYQKSFWVVPASDTRNIKSLDEAHRDLNVTLAVTGSIEHTSNGVNLIANLVDAVNHRQLASRSMHVESASLDEMQQRVWEAVADMLDLQVSPQVKQELAAGGTTQPGAYELYEQGVGYLERQDLEDVDRAIDLFNKSVAKDPNYALAYAGLGDAYARKYVLTKDPEWIAAGTRNAGRAVELDGQLIPVRLSLANVYQQTGQLDKALAEYKRVLEQDPTVIDAEIRVGQVYLAQGNYAEAEKAFQDAIARRPNYWLGYANLMALYYGKGQFAQAAQQSQSVIDLAPANPVGYYDLAAAYIGMGRYEDAIGALKKGLDIRSDAFGWTDLGACYMYLGKWEEAAEAMKRAVDLSPHDHTLWRNLGDSYDEIPSRQADARQAYAKALETATEQLKVNPKDPAVLSGIALYHAHLGDKQEAEEFISQALAAAPNDSDTLFTSALVYEIIGDRDKALEALSKAYKAGYSLEEIAKEPELRKLQSDPLYQRWLQEVKRNKQ
ncbi:MAG TPA: tetratricopeptide repeat protein [Terriglobales bacterium]|nr:tetratricopeptide repeat protein [Terriglobales bacterium]